MDLAETQLRISRLIELALRSPSAEEGRSAAVAACRLIRESGLLIVRPDELVTFVTGEAGQQVSGSAGQPETKTKAKRKRRAKRDLSEVISEGTEGFVTAVDAAGRIVSTVNNFRQAFRR